MVCSKVSDPTHYILFIVSDCCLTPNEQFCRYMMARTSYIRYHEMIMMSALYKTNTLNSWIFIVLAHWNNNPRVDMSFYLDILSLFQANQSLFFFLNAATNTNVLSLCFNLKILSRFTRLWKDKCYFHWTLHERILSDLRETTPTKKCKNV